MVNATICLMAKQGLVALNEGQKECLRLVFDHKTSKEIARRLGISPHTVDQRIRIAMQKLGVVSRVEAAKIVMRSEEKGTYQTPVYQTLDIADAPENDHSTNANEMNRGGSFTENSKKLRLPLPSKKGVANDLTVIERLVWIVGIAIFSAISFGAILTGIDALQHILTN